MKWLLLIILIPYIYILLKISRSLKGIKPYSSVISPDIFVSVIVACRNEENNIPGLLNHISEQDYDPDLFELIITDDNSTDRTFTSCRRIQEDQEPESIKKRWFREKTGIKNRY